jgi:hypothetical protein
VRLIAGAAGGRRLAVPPRGTRPTSDRVREALFAALAHDPGLVGANVLDLCAGSGALGLEALSRGAAHALFVESDRRAAGVLRRNIADVGLPGTEVRVAPAAAVLAGPAARAYDLALVDPATRWSWSSAPPVGPSSAGRPDGSRYAGAATGRPSSNSRPATHRSKPARDMAPNRRLGQAKTAVWLPTALGPAQERQYGSERRLRDVGRAGPGC